MAKGLTAVTGATGFLGRRLVPALAARGWRVRILARRPPDGSWGGAAPDVVIGDIEDSEALRRLADGADVVIHAAGLIKARSRAAFFAVNVDGARRVARAARGRRMILVSSLAAREPGLSNYAASKRAGETAARDGLGEGLTVLRPPALYGPGDHETLGLFRLAATAPILPTPASRAARVALAHVDDVAAHILDRIDGAWTPGTFAIGGHRPAGYGWREIFTTAAGAVGRAPPLAPAPAWLIAGAAAISEAVGRWRGAPVIFNRGKARELLHDDWSVRETEMVPGFRPPCVELSAGFAETVAWYREHGWLS